MDLKHEGNLVMHRWTYGRPLSGIHFLAAIILVSSMNCAPTVYDNIPEGHPEPDTYLYETGQAAMEDRKWFRARALFRRIVDTFPQSSYRFDAKIELGRSYYLQGGLISLIEARNEFEEFLRFFPTNARADYAQYLIGMTYFEATLDPDRDQTQTLGAIEAFNLLLDTYPESQYRDETLTALRNVRDLQGESELRVARFYFDHRWWPGAIKRLRQLLKDDPEFSGLDHAYYYLAESLVRMNSDAEALPYFEQLIDEFASSEWTTAANVRIAQLKNPTP